MLQERYIGLMSGTSLDGVDGVLCALHQDGRWDHVLAHCHHPFETDLREQLLALQHSGPDELHRAAVAANRLARAYAAVCHDLLQVVELSTAEVLAVGVHGQTVRHQPGGADGVGYTLQINQPALLAELCGIDVIADFRSRDLAAGGQGAPLVPPFHQALFGASETPRAVVNIGGISNLTLLPSPSTPSAQVRGFDCGPGNALLDHWCAQHTGEPFDAEGAWAAQGRVDAGLLARLLSEPFLGLAPPKSTGRDLFNAGWLATHLQDLPSQLAAEDVQATLSEFTAAAIADQLQHHGTQTRSLLVCGGGALNLDLMRRLQARLPGCHVEATSAHGLPPLQVEAAAFAWLARMFCHAEPTNLPSVTGARGPRILGARYPA